MLKKSTIEDQFIGSRLKLRRSQLGVSQTQLARFEKLTFQQVQKYESGVNKISGGRLYRFARILHIPMDYFYEGIDDFIEAQEGNKYAQAKVEATKLDAETSRRVSMLVKAFLKLNIVEQKAVIATAKALIKKGGSDE